MLDEDKVKVPSLKKYPCKKNKGEHIWGIPIITYKSIRYIQKTGSGILSSDIIHPEFKFMHAELSIFVENRCDFCGKKHLSVLTDKLK